MPKIQGAPKELNDLLEKVFSECMLEKRDDVRCSKISFGAAENAGWKKNNDTGEWEKN